MFGRQYGFPNLEYFIFSEIIKGKAISDPAFAL
jgi:hypothetical protein